MCFTGICSNENFDGECINPYAEDCYLENIKQEEDDEDKLQAYGLEDK